VPGTLTIAGDCRFGPKTKYVMRVQSANAGGYSSVDVTGDAALDGSLEIKAAAGFAPAAGDRLVAVSSKPGSPIAGRFAKATLPSPVKGLFLRVEYSMNECRLVTSSTVAGFDLYAPPVGAAWDVALRDFAAAPAAAGAAPGAARRYNWVGSHPHRSAGSHRCRSSNGLDVR
jgi:hypothetical protein